ncbi:MAG TPA: helix-turn-helix transcriptional regulator [Sphingomonadaceae bacterium]|nr:helix-turn-helix transcriptional regulator [Sphingomonadaceae bacterium]
MSGLVSKDADTEWKVVQSGARGNCHYENVLGTSITVVDFSGSGSVLPVGYGFLDDLISEYESDPELRDDLAAARQEMGADLLAGGRPTVAALRLSIGLSQADLASLLGTSQAAVSRLESGQQEPRLPMLRKLASALRVDLNTLDRAFYYE